MPSQVITNLVPGPASLPHFEPNGNLPVGIHSSTLSELYRTFRFNEHRRKMWLQLSSFLISPVLKSKFAAAYVGGGFFSEKPHPSDIDLVLETACPYGPEAFESVAPFFVTGLDKIEMIYGVHLQFWMRGAPPGLTDYRMFFQYERPDNLTPILNRSRGIVRIDLTEFGTLDRLRRYIRGENTTAIPITSSQSRSPMEEIGRLSGIKRQLCLMAANSSKLIVLTDALGRIEWVNDCFARACGYTLEEVRGQKPGTLLQGPASDPNIIQRLQLAISEVHECECEIVNYRKDGTPYVVKITLSPLFEEQELVGFLAVEEDMGPPGSALTMVDMRQVAA